MPNLTENFNLKKPIAEVETADIEVINENMDIIDKELARIEKDTKTELSLKLDKGSYKHDASELKAEIDKKEPAFLKNTAFNKGVPSGKRGITTLRIFLTIYDPFIFNA